jgi:hypothetical protein
VIAFATLFLGLMVGARPVTVIVGDTVTAVAFELDGRPAGRLTASPWTATVDFGAEFTPHELVARAYDEKGDEVALARQWINLPRPPAEVEVVLERDAQGRAAAARLTWESVLGVKPESVSVTFDGRPLPMGEGQRVAVPGYDPATTHVLTVSLDYGNGVRTRNDVVLGGGSASEAKTELTAVPVLARRAKAPKRKDVQGRFRKGSQRLAVAAVERGPAEVIVVRDLDSTEAQRIYRSLRGSRSSAAGFLAMPRGAGYSVPQTTLEPEDHFRILWPVARQVVDRGVSNDLFDGSRTFSGWMGDFRFLLTNVDYPESTSKPRRFADAVALGGLRAFATYSRRAVVLVVGSRLPDESRYEPGAVRRYLDRLHVPLYVWSLMEPARRPPEAAVWGEMEDISSLSGLERAVEKLKKEIDRQSIVWLEGRHLPQDIMLEPGDDGLALVE